MDYRLNLGASLTRTPEGCLGAEKQDSEELSRRLATLVNFYVL